MIRAILFLVSYLWIRFETHCTLLQTLLGVVLSIERTDPSQCIENETFQECASHCEATCSNRQPVGTPWMDVHQNYSTISSAFARVLLLVASAPEASSVSTESVSPEHSVT